MSTLQLSKDVRLAATFAAAVSCLMIAQQIAAKSLRDALFLVNFRISSLPVLMFVSAVLSLAMVIVMSRVMARRAPITLVPRLFILSSVFYAGEWLASSHWPRAIAIVVYVHTVTFGASAVSGFWSVINEHFNPYEAKRVMGSIGGGATLGGLAGGVAVWLGAPHIEPNSLLLLLAGANLACGLILSRLKTGVPGGQRLDTPPPSRSSTAASKERLFETLRNAPYLRHIGIFVLLSALGASLFDYVFKAQAAAKYSDGQELISFFALFYTVVGVATLLIQHGLVHRVLVRFGITTTTGILPSLVIPFGIAAVVLPGFHSAVILQGVSRTAENSFHRSAYELLYTPLPSTTKRKVKLVLDVGADRAGAALGSALTLALLASLGANAEPWLLMLSVLMAATMLLVLVRLNRGYVLTLAKRMRSGNFEFEQGQNRDLIDRDIAKLALQRTMEHFDLGRVSRSSQSPPATTYPEGEERSGSRASLTRLYAAIHRYKRIHHESANSGDVEAQANLNPPLPAPVEKDTPSVVVAAALRSRNIESIRQVLTLPEAATPALLGQFIPVLDDARLRPVVEPFLRRYAPRIVGQMIDALLSPRLNEFVRARVAILLASVPTERSSQGLALGLSDSSFTISHHCAVALLQMKSKGSKLAPDKEILLRVVTEELGRSCSERRSSSVSDDFEPSPFSKLAQGNVTMQLVQVFTLLALYFDREHLLSAFRTLQTQDEGTRGTALEYLETVLPRNIRNALFARINHGEVASHRLAFDAKRVAQLGLSLGKNELSLEDLRRIYREGSNEESP